MEKYNEIITSLARKKRNVVGEYSILTTLISSIHDIESGFNIPYNLSIKEFNENFIEIEKALTYYHEMSHYISYLSTTNCILHHLSYTNVIDNILKMLDRHVRFKLPLNLYYKEILNKAQNNNNLTDDDHSFSSYFTGTLELSENARWLEGTLSEEGLFFKLYQRKPLLNGAAYSLNFKTEFLNIFSSGIVSKEYWLYDIYRDNFKSLGILQLCECFAKSIEFEHLAWFNSNIYENILQQWINDIDAIDYNLPARIFYELQQRGFLRADRKIDFFWAHMRIFIDISLMHSDYLLTDEISFRKNTNTHLLSSTIQPGVTFFRVLEAFNKCKPLKNHNEDILRLYDDLCMTLNIPSLPEMINKLIRLIKIRFDIENGKTSLTAGYYTLIMQMLEKKLENPLLFINDLIYSDKFENIEKVIKPFSRINTPKGLFADESNFLNLLLLEQVEIFIYELLNNYPIRCSYDLTMNKYETNKTTVRTCLPKKEKYSDCSNCPILSYIELVENQKLN